MYKSTIRYNKNVLTLVLNEYKCAQFIDSFISFILKYKFKA